MRLYLRAMAYFREDLSKIILSLLLIGLSTLLGLLQPWPLAILIDSVLAASHREHWVHRLFFRLVPSQSMLVQIISLAVATLLLRLFQELLQMFQTMVKIRVGYNGLMRVRCDLFRKLQAL